MSLDIDNEARQKFLVLKFDWNEKKYNIDLSDIAKFKKPVHELSHIEISQQLEECTEYALFLGIIAAEWKRKMSQAEIEFEIWFAKKSESVEKQLLDEAIALRKGEHKLPTSMIPSVTKEKIKNRVITSNEKEYSELRIDIDYFEYQHTIFKRASEEIRERARDIKALKEK